jgi:hypothetical protein
MQANTSIEPPLQHYRLFLFGLFDSEPRILPPHAPEVELLSYLSLRSTTH